ncbi:GerMN domain-containing protein [Actinopolymorpha sp. B17G11]|uniref:GerMN domain-containing protein n=1 Tax=Actinopolymorpha sp. B17G11 TaxID=3160861 RepID=UPI0032E50F36
MSRRTVGLLLVGAVLSAASALLGGCGVPSQDRPTLIEPTTVPFGLLSNRSAAAKAGATPLPGSDTSADPFFHTSVAVYFVEGKTLVGVKRKVRPGPLPDRVDVVVEALTSGPAAPEQARGLSSAIPPGLRLAVASFEAGQVTIDLAGDPAGLTAAESPLTIGQVVLSLTSLPGVERVQLTRDHKPVEVPLVDGSLTTRPLAGVDYQVLRDRPTPPAGN